VGSVSLRGPRNHRPESMVALYGKQHGIQNVPKRIQAAVEIRQPGSKLGPPSSLVFRKGQSMIGRASSPFLVCTLLVACHGNKQLGEECIYDCDDFTCSEGDCGGDLRCGRIHHNRTVFRQVCAPYCSNDIDCAKNEYCQLSSMDEYPSVCVERRGLGEWCGKCLEGLVCSPAETCVQTCTDVSRCPLGMGCSPLIAEYDDDERHGVRYCGPLPPSSDQCAGAIELTLDVSAESTTLGAANDYPVPSADCVLQPNSESDVVFSFTPAETKKYVVFATWWKGTAPSPLAHHPGALWMSAGPCGLGVCKISDPSGGPLRAQLNAGVTYYIFVGSDPKYWPGTTIRVQVSPDW
jgi:hypothetical protein